MLAAIMAPVRDVRLVETIGDDEAATDEAVAELERVVVWGEEG